MLFVLRVSAGSRGAAALDKLSELGRTAILGCVRRCETSLDRRGLSRLARRIAGVVVGGSVLVVTAALARAGAGACGQPVTVGDRPLSSDALYTLRAAVGLELCPNCLCDADGSGGVRATDALLVLSFAAFDPQASLSCPACVCGVKAVDRGDVCDGSDEACPGTRVCGPDCTCVEPCPGSAEIEMFAATGGHCAANADCPTGTCDTDLGRCVTPTDLDLGWSGLAHDLDTNDGDVTRVRLACSGQAPVCGECDIVGIEPSPGSCRCADDNRVACDEPFVPDDDDCGGTQCHCYLGPPLPVSAGAMPACFVRRLTKDLSGTLNVDTGAIDMSLDVQARVYLGDSFLAPCPVCGGRCRGAPETPCVFDQDCDENCLPGRDCDDHCVFDEVKGDGKRGGVCVGGADAGAACDVEVHNTSFPARYFAEGGGGYSLDCFPDAARDVSGDGLRLLLRAGTGEQRLDSGVPCRSDSAELCPCKQCSGEPGVPCRSDEDCAGQRGRCSVVGSVRCDASSDCMSVSAGACMSWGRCSGSFTTACETDGDCNGLDGGVCMPSSCSSAGTGDAPKPNACSHDGLCVEQGEGEASCSMGPTDFACEEILRADGTGLVPCTSNGDCLLPFVSVDGGRCTLAKRRECFVDPVVALGAEDPEFPLVATTFCSGPTSNVGINRILGLPGPVRLLRQQRLTTFCANDPALRYQPGVGGCRR
jgi:hypothetical protein